MGTLGNFFAVVALSSLPVIRMVEARNYSCPPWFYFNYDKSRCECPSFIPWGIRCSQSKLKIEVADGYCVSFIHNRSYAGNCLYAHTGNFTDRAFSEAPCDPDRLNDYMCGNYNRKGLLCGQCIYGYGPAAFSLEMKCVDCSMLSSGGAFILYLALEFIPITLFFIVVMITRLDVTAGPMLGYVIFCQSYVFGIETKPFLVSHIFHHASGIYKILMHISLALSNVWLLRFAFIFSPPICVSANFTNIDLVQLGFVRPAIPVFLLAFICIVTELEKRNFKIVKFCWRHLKTIFKWVPVQPVDGNALIRTFASFIFLSSYVSNFAFLSAGIRNEIYEIDWSTSYVLYFDPTIIPYSHKHFLYMTIPSISLIFLVLIPSFLLAVYPTRLYSYLSKFLSQRKHLAITTFAEALHSCFRNGLGGTPDYRALAGLILASEILYPSSAYIFYITLNAILDTDQYTLNVVQGAGLVLLALVLSYLKPCKTEIANLSLSYHTMALGIMSMAITTWTNDFSTTTTTLENLFVGLPIISHTLVFSWAGYLLVKKIFSYPCVSLA